MKLLHYQKPVLWVLLGTVLACIAAAVLFLVNPFGAKGDALLLQVLNNKETFIKESGEAVSLQAYIQSASNDAASAPQRYTLVDLDGDGEEELVAYIDCDGGKYLIFHIYDGKVYGFAFAGRDFQNLKTDGTFVQNQNSNTNYFYALEFDKTAYRLKELAYHNRVKNKARLGGEEATAEDATVFAVEFWKKPAVQWTAVGEAADPIPLYREFLDGKTTAEDNFTQKKLSDYFPSSGAYEYAFYDMTGDGQAELCVSSVFGIDIFTVQNSSLQHWYTGETSEARLMENGMVLEESYEYDLSAMYYSYQGLTERGQTMFSLHFSWTDVKYTYPDMYTFNRLEVTQEEDQKKTEEYFALKEMAGEAVTGNTKPANYDSLLLQVLNNKKTFYNEDGKAVYLKDHTAASDPFGLTSASRYTLVDMDGDGTNEMVVSFLPNGAYGSYTVFRVHKRQVYGYDFPYNSMQSLKTDGAFMKKDTHSNTYYLTLTFEDTGYQIHELAYCNSAYHADRVCRIGGKAVTLEEVTAYRKEFTLKPDAVWETAPLTDEGNTYALYQAFLAGETKAKQDNGNEYFFGTYLLADYIYLHSVGYDRRRAAGAAHQAEVQSAHFHRQGRTGLPLEHRRCPALYPFEQRRIPI